MHSVGITFAQGYETGRVIEIEDEQQFQDAETQFFTQQLRVRLEDGSEESVTHGTEFQPLAVEQRLQVGQEVILTEDPQQESSSTIADRYRLPTLAWLGVGFFVLVSLVAGKKGIFSVVGMFVSLTILTQFLVPSILNGSNPLLISIITALSIAAITVYLSHGFSLKSHLSLFSMVTTLILVTVLAQMAVQMAFLFGFGSEEAAFLQLGEMSRINLQGLLLGGIMLGALGILDDICMAQVSTVIELKKANPDLSISELYHRGMSVGKDHVASLANTLVLAYAGTNLPLFILFSTSNEVPLWVRLNSEFIAEEIVRTLVGSIGLVLAVPLTTLVAAYFIRNQKKSVGSK